MNLDPFGMLDYAKKMQVIYTDTWVDMEFFNNPAYQQQKEETLAKMMRERYSCLEEIEEGELYLEKALELPLAEYEPYIRDEEGAVSFG